MTSHNSLRSIAIFTGTRADYGILRPLIFELMSRKLDTRVVVSGSHLTATHGETVNEIEADGIPIHARIPILDHGTSSLGVCIDIGSAVAKFGKYLAENVPDIVVVLGDRLEALAMAIASMINGVPIAHIHGGEITTGAMDDKIRHAITKISNLHFVSTNEYENRVLRLGENASNIFNVGALAIDNLHLIPRDSRAETMKFLGFYEEDYFAVVSYHPAQYEMVPPKDQIKNIINSLLGIENLKILVTGVNSDIGSENVNRVIEYLARENPSRVFLSKSLGSKRYFDVLAHAEFAIGNSSSLVIETPSLGVPAIIVGDRQRGRVTSKNTLMSTGDVQSIRNSISSVLSEEFRISCSESQSPYGTPGVAIKIVDKLLDQVYPLSTQKIFVDIELIDRGINIV